MNAIFLGGESINNKVWIEEVEKSLGELFNQTKILYYDHWESGQSTIDLDREFAKLPSLVEGLDKSFQELKTPKPRGGGFFLFAKSIGSVLALRGIHEKILQPEKCFFAGPAFLVGERDIPDFKKYIQDFSVPSIVLCKTSDPVAPAKETDELLKRYNVQNNKFLEIPGDNHKYEDLDEIKKLISNFVE